MHDMWVYLWERSRLTAHRAVEISTGPPLSDSRSVNRTSTHSCSHFSSSFGGQGWGRAKLSSSGAITSTNAVKNAPLYSTFWSNSAFFRLACRWWTMLYKCTLSWHYKKNTHQSIILAIMLFSFLSYEGIYKALKDCGIIHLVTCRAAPLTSYKGWAEILAKSKPSLFLKITEYND